VEKVFVAALYQTFLEAWYHLEESPKNPMFSTFPWVVNQMDNYARQRRQYTRG
jgi:hypothetical protein